MSRLLLHLDLDAFYAAIEQRDRPEWIGRPLVVGAAPGGRGVVATCSYEARRYGVRSAMPISEAARRLPPETIYVRPQMRRYAEVSREVMTALSALSPIIEPVSVDEAYIDITGLERLFGTPREIGARAKRLVADAVGLSASVGIGPNRLIAKLASEHGKPNGLIVVAADAVRAFLDPMPIDVLRGVGRRTTPQLKRLGLETVGDLRRMSLERLRRTLGAHQGTALHLQAQGLADDRVEPARQRKSISKETTFSEDILDTEPLRETLRWAAQEVGYLARHAERRGSQVTLKIRFRGFETHTRSRLLNAPTDDDRTLFRAAWQLFETAPWGQRPVRLIGLGLSGWPERQAHQPDLFAELDQQAPPRSSPLTGTLDAIRERFGPGAIQRGAPRPSKH